VLPSPVQRRVMAHLPPRLSHACLATIRKTPCPRTTRL
jgi:hypothetical protein